MKIKILEKNMIFAEAEAYCESHTKYRLANAIEAFEIRGNLKEDQEMPDKFWISDKLRDIVMVYNTKTQSFEMSHPNIKYKVVLIFREWAK